MRFCKVGKRPELYVELSRECGGGRRCIGARGRRLFHQNLRLRLTNKPVDHSYTLARGEIGAVAGSQRFGRRMNEINDVSSVKRQCFGYVRVASAPRNETKR